MNKLAVIIQLSIMMSVLVACNGTDVFPEDHQTSDTAIEMELIKVLKRVKTYNCEGQEISDDWSVWSAPKERIQIRPSTYRNLTGSHFRNNTTNSSPSWVIGHDSFNIDMASTLFNMRVNEGINEISYKFSFCDSERNDSEPCDDSYEEVGNLYMNIKYRVEREEGIYESHPSEEECNVE